MYDNFANNNKLGLPLDAPSTQTILPVMIGNNGKTDSQGNLVQSEGNAIVIGWIPIASTTFNGTETTFATSDGPIPITSVTLPLLNRQGNIDGGSRVHQFMAAVFPTYPLIERPWLGFSDFISANESQYAMQWFMPTQGQGYHLNKGPLITDLTIRMNADAGTAPPVPPGPDVTPATLYWACSLTMNDLEAKCGFIDFNWVNLFEAQESFNEPMRIEVVSNPPTGEFKTTIVPYPVVTPTGGVEFNTLRIIKLKDVAPGNYVFNYKVWDTHGQSTPVVLTLTVI